MTKLNTNDFSKKAQNLLKFSDGETMHLIYKGDKLCLQTRTVTVYVNAEDIGDQQVFIPQKAIALINKISSDEFQMGAAGDTLTVKYNRSSSDFQMSKKFFEPKIFDEDMPKMNVIDKGLLPQIKKITRYCSADTQTSNVAVGCYFNGNGRNIEIAATDGYRLILFKTACKSKIQLLIPKKETERIIALAISENVDIECCEISEQKVLFKVGKYFIITPTLIFEKFVDYNSALKFDTFPVTINVAEMKSAIERITIVNGNNKKPIIVESNKSDIKVASSANETSKGSEFISASFDSSKEFKRGFNGIWLADMLSNYSGDVDINMGEYSQMPIYVEAKTDTSSLLTMIFPMRVRDMK